MLMAAGVQFPKTAAALGAIWSLGRYLYMTGYTNPQAGKEGKGRYRGMIFYIGEGGLLGLSAWVGLGMVLKGAGVF